MNLGSLQLAGPVQDLVETLGFLNGSFTKPRERRWLPELRHLHICPDQSPQDSDRRLPTLSAHIRRFLLPRVPDPNGSKPERGFTDLAMLDTLVLSNTLMSLDEEWYLAHIPNVRRIPDEDTSQSERD